MSIPADSLLPLTLRLNAIESKLYGGPKHDESANSNGYPDKAGESSRTALRRAREIQEKLERAGEGNEGLKRIVGNYETYLPLLSLSDPTVPAATGFGSDANGTRSTSTAPTSEWDIVPDAVKVTMLLEAAEDIKRIERDLRDVEVFKTRGVEGSGELEKLLSLQSELQTAQNRARDQSTSLASARREVSDLLQRYNEYTAAVSDLFLDIHRRLEMMEEEVSRAERRKRRELAERY